MASVGEILSWPSTTLCGRVASVLGGCELTHEYGDILKTLSALMSLLNKVCIVQCGKEKKHMAAAMGCPLLWAVYLDTVAQQEAEAQVWKFGK